MQTKKENWIEEVLTSADNISRVPAPCLIEKVLARTGEIAAKNLQKPIIQRANNLQKTL